MGGRSEGGGEGAVRARSAILAVAGLVSLIAVSAVPAGSIAAAKDSFEPGVYVGKTSQGEPIKLRVGSCGKSQCLYSTSETHETIVSLPCPALGESASESILLSGELIRKSGEVDADQDGFAKLTIRFKVGHDGTITGRIDGTETLESGVRCASGNVTVSAKLKG
jgi:hypothetical protein